MVNFASDVLLDHMVINVRLDMDAAEETFAALGFTVTPRGYHTLGSINHLMVLASDYLELIGVPHDGDVVRQEVVNAPMAINGLVFKTDDVDATYAHLCALGINGDEPRSFSRPVELDGETHHARFRTVAVRGGEFAAGRVYFCQHLTPELIWRSPWCRHKNSARRTDEFIVVTPDVLSEAQRYAQLLKLDAAEHNDGASSIDLCGAKLVLMQPRAYQQRFAQLALECSQSCSTFGGITIGCGSLDAAKAALASAPASCRVRHTASSVQVCIDAYGTVLEFRA